VMSLDISDEKPIQSVNICGRERCLNDERKSNAQRGLKRKNMYRNMKDFLDMYILLVHYFQRDGDILDASSWVHLRLLQYF